MSEVIRCHNVTFLDETQAVVADVDWRLFKSVYEITGQRLLDGFEAAPAATPRTGGSPLSDMLAGISEDFDTDGRRALIGYLQDEAAAVLGYDQPRRIDPNRSLFELGMDSIMAVDFKNRLERGVSITLPATVVFIAAYLRLHARESRAMTVKLTVGGALLSYVLFHMVLRITWPGSLLGDMVPALRQWQAIF